MRLPEPVVEKLSNLSLDPNFVNVLDQARLDVGKLCLLYMAWKLSKKEFAEFLDELETFWQALTELSAMDFERELIDSIKEWRSKRK